MIIPKPHPEGGRRLWVMMLQSGIDLFVSGIRKEDVNEHEWRCATRWMINR